MKPLVFSALALLLGANAALAADYPVTVTDVVGRSVTIEKKPERIILQDGRDMLTMALLDRDNPYKRVVGWSSNFVKSDPGTAKLMDKAFGKAPPVMTLSEDGEVDLESIIAAKPDLVVVQERAEKTFQASGTEDKLKALGIPVVYLDLMEKPVEDATKSVEVLGKAIGREKEASDYVSFYKQHLDHLNEVIAKQETHPNVFVEAKAGNKGDGCCFTHGDTGFGKLVAALKGNNIGTKLLPGQTGTISLETLLGANPPDVYIMTGSQWTNPENSAAPFGYNVTPQQVSASLGKLEERDGFAALKAVQDGRVYGLYHQFYNHPYNIVGLEYMATFLYPDAFKGLDPAATYATLIKTFTKIPDAPVVLGASAPVTQ
ncbi:ABC transporter substrate-binding protein [Neorhizobium sp. NCHU2750]|uniref:ABC transporter substrate-binding protein n=1 Tax=Neorhizobium sp. NCHU2750 TaxID=1825976 RepID=UPI000EB75730|nr:iron ABC transporter substrate-binding protein [Neorhizobium sp. NCHU2750]